MPMHMTSLFTPEELKTSALTAGFNFTKNMPVLRIDALRDARRIPNNDRVGWSVDLGTTLYDLHLDRTQMRPFRDSEIELRLSEGIRSVLIAHDAPEEYYRRYGLAAMDVGS